MEEFPYVNEVVLVGRVSGEPRRRGLRNGGEFTEWRFIVERAPPDRKPDGKTRKVVDTLRCVTFDDKVRELVGAHPRGDLLELRGSLRRRFWRGEDGPASRYEVEVKQAACAVE